MVTGMGREPSHTGEQQEDRSRRLLSMTLPRLFLLPVFSIILTLGITAILLSAQTLVIPTMHAGSVAQQTIRVPQTITYVDQSGHCAGTSGRRGPCATGHGSRSHRKPGGDCLRTTTLHDNSAHSGGQLDKPGQRLTALRQALSKSPNAALATTIAPLNVAAWNTSANIVLNNLRETTAPGHALTSSAVPGVITHAMSTAGLNVRQRTIVRAFLTTYLHPNARDRSCRYAARTQHRGKSGSAGDVHVASRAGYRSQW